MNRCNCSRLRNDRENIHRVVFTLLQCSSRPSSLSHSHMWSRWSLTAPDWPGLVRPAVVQLSLVLSLSLSHCVSSRLRQWLPANEGSATGHTQLNGQDSLCRASIAKVLALASSRESCVRWTNCELVFATLSLMMSCREQNWQDNLTVQITVLVTMTWIVQYLATDGYDYLAICHVFSIY